MTSSVKGTVKWLVAIFLAGLFALLPLAITIAIVTWVASFILAYVGPDTVIGGAVRAIVGHWVRSEVLATLLGWMIVLGLIFLIGVLVQHKAKDWLLGGMDRLFAKIPVIGGVYGTAAQFVKMLNKADANELSGMSVVMVRFGDESGAGLLALMPTNEKYEFHGREYCLVYVPTSPVPMTGGLIYVPAASVERMDMTVENLMSVYLSMGVTCPQVMAKRVAAP